jgi:hypothetical protein
MLTLPTMTGGVVMLQRIVATMTDSSIATLVLDPATGESLAELDAWSFTGDLGPDVLLIHPAQLSPDGTSPDARWLGRWRADPPGFELLGTLEADWCYPLTPKYLSCGSSAAPEAELWRVR